MCASYVLPGRIGDPSMSLARDPRIRPQLLKQLEKLGAAGNEIAEYPALNHETVDPIVAKAGAGFQMLYDNVQINVPGDENEPEVIATSEMYTSFDGTELEFRIFRRADLQGQKLPGVFYSHGGGMVWITTFNAVHIRWAKTLAIQGVAVILVDFRNAYSVAKYNPFPTGLNDLAAAFKHVSANRDRLGIDKLILQGESGGGNLTLAQAIKAKREGYIEDIAGVFSVVPYIANAFSWSRERKLEELPSLVENDGYFLNSGAVYGAGWYYNPDSMEDPLAWPYYVDIEELKGMPPHRLALDELDLLRDEGLAYFRKLLKAGVHAHATVSPGTVHGSALLFRESVSEYHDALAKDIAAFAKGL